MQALVISELSADEPTVEVVERKGLGHPDTICDALAENLSRDLSREYRGRFGQILHHNVDKALLCAGRASPAFRGGRIDAPMDIYLAGRATADAGGTTIPLVEIATEGAKRWLRENLRGLDADHHVRIHPVLRPGSQALRDLFGNRGLLANDTSIGVGFAPLSRLEQLVLAIDRALAEGRTDESGAAWGEDAKIMAVRHADAVELTVSCAMIGRALGDLDDYLAAKTAIESLALEQAHIAGFEACSVSVNAADRPSDGALYLTVTGTSGEAGDDGQVGRGNRVNGLITPGRPMSLEAAAGKNPVTHVGKIYNIACNEVAREIIARIPLISQAHCMMVSRIGHPITEPAIIDVKVATYHAGLSTGLHRPIEAIVSGVLAALPRRADDFVAGRIGLY
jgi:S-adenosylmethionine synthetase